MRKNTLIISTLKTSTDYKYHSDIVIEAKCQLETLNVWYFLTISYQLGSYEHNGNDYPLLIGEARRT